LIQNAEDCLYKRATRSGATPYITFAIYHDKVIVECNEDGFTFEDVESICKTGASLKAESPGYIGEKGIGFKSVFMVASKVYIQSRAYSFYFEYDGGSNAKRKNGMGMVIPVWQEPAPDEHLQGPLTRMTLTLRNELDFSKLLQQFEDLHDTLLLFLKKLRRISIEKYDEKDRETSITTYVSREDEARHRVTLTKSVKTKRTRIPEETETYYYMVRKTARGLPNRGKVKNETSEVVLAFPITASSVPIVEHQEVYAYLPIHDFGFSVSLMFLS
jgi:HSP90 family molecular chaperone